MRNLFAKLWADDAGVVTIEYLVLGVFLAIALIVGVASLSAAINAELSELAGTILTFNSSYVVSGQSSCVANYSGGGASDLCGTIQINLTTPVVCNVSDIVCN